MKSTAGTVGHTTALSWPLRNPAAEQQFQLQYGAPGAVMGLTVAFSGLVYQVWMLLSARAGKWLTKKVAAIATWTTAVRIVIFSTAILAVCLLGRNRYTFLRGLISLPQRVLFIVGLGLTLQPAYSSIGASVWPHRLGLLHLTCIICRVPARWYWLSAPLNWLAAVLTDFADPSHSCTDLMACYATIAELVRTDARSLVRSVMSPHSSTIHLVYTILPGVVLTYLEATARREWQQRRYQASAAAATRGIAPAAAAASNKQDIELSDQRIIQADSPSTKPQVAATVDAERRNALKSSAVTTGNSKQLKQPATGPTQGSVAQAHLQPVTVWRSALTAANPAQSASACADSIMHATITATETVGRIAAADQAAAATATAASADTVLPVSTMAYIDNLADSDALLETIELARQTAIGSSGIKHNLKIYKGCCRIDTASIKVAASRADLATLGPLLQSCLLTALDKYKVSSRGDSSHAANTVIGDAVYFDGCVQLLAQILAIAVDQGGQLGVDRCCCCCSSPVDNAAAAAKLLQLVHDALQHAPGITTVAATAAAAEVGVEVSPEAAPDRSTDSLVPVTIVWGNASAAAPIGSSSSDNNNGLEECVSDTASVASEAAETAAARTTTGLTAGSTLAGPQEVMALLTLIGCHPVCIVAGEPCHLEILFAPAVAAAAGAAVTPSPIEDGVGVSKAPAVAAAAAPHAAVDTPALAAAAIDSQQGSHSSVQYRCIVSQHNRLILDKQVLLGSQLQLELPILPAGVVHLALLATEGPLQRQLTPVVKHTLLVLPPAAAAELQSWVLQSAPSDGPDSRSLLQQRQWQQQKHSSVSQLAVDVSYVLAGASQRMDAAAAAAAITGTAAATTGTTAATTGTAAAAFPAQLLVLHQVAKHLASIDCWQVLDAIIGAVQTCATSATVRMRSTAEASCSPSCQGAVITSSLQHKADSTAAAALQSNAATANAAKHASPNMHVPSGVKQPKYESAAAVAAARPTHTVLAAGSAAQCSRSWISVRCKQLLGLCKPLLTGFPTPTVEAAFVQYVAQGSLYSDIAGAVYYVMVVLSLRIIIDPLESTAGLQLVWELFSRAATFAMLVVPNVSMLLFRRPLVASGRRETAIVFCEWCSAVFILAVGLGILVQNATSRQIYAKTNTARTVMLLVSGTNRAALRQARARRLILPAVVEAFGYVRIVQDNGAGLQGNVQRFVLSKVLTVLAAAVIELWHRQAFLQQMQRSAPDAGTGAEAAAILLKQVKAAS